MAQPFRHACIIKTLQNSFKRNPIYHWNDCYSELFCCASTLFHNTQHFYLTSGNDFFMAAFQEPVSTHTHMFKTAYYSHYFSSMHTAHNKWTFCTELT